MAFKEGAKHHLNLQCIGMTTVHRMHRIEVTTAASARQGLEAGQAEARAEIAAVQAEKADTEGRLAQLEDKLEALEAENAHLESMKVHHEAPVCPFLHLRHIIPWCLTSLL